MVNLVTHTLTELFNEINNCKEFLWDWKIDILYKIYKGLKRKTGEPGNYKRKDDFIYTW